MLNLLLRIDFG
jgi:hypothetical protein